MSRSGKGENVGMRCVDCNTFIYMQERSHAMKLEKKSVSDAKKFCKKCRKKVSLKEFSKFHFSDKLKPKKSARNVAKLAALAQAEQAAAKPEEVKAEKPKVEKKEEAKVEEATEEKVEAVVAE